MPGMERPIPPPPPGELVPAGGEDAEPGDVAGGEVVVGGAGLPIPRVMEGRIPPPPKPSPAPEPELGLGLELAGLSLPEDEGVELG